MDADLTLLATRVGEFLQARRLALVTAESCTGGGVAEAVTRIAGSSAWFACGYVTYSNASKTKMLGVTPLALEQHGAVSEEVAYEMVDGALYHSNADVALAITGIAGPEGGTPDKPVGTVCFAWQRRSQPVLTVTHHFFGDRERIRREAIMFSLSNLLHYIENPHIPLPPYKPAAAAEAETKTTPPYPFDLLDDCKYRLATLFDQLRIDEGTPSTLPNFEALAREYRSAMAVAAARMAVPFSAQVLAICEILQLICNVDKDAVIGATHLDDEGQYTVLHPLHQAVFVELMATRLGVTASERLPMLAAALTANIASLNLQEVLHHQTEPLSAAQQRLIRIHPMLSNEMLIELGVDDPAWSAAVLSHHERADGNGYPDGLLAEQIPLGARLVALADVYDAMIKPRQHRAANLRAALRDLFVKRGEAIDARLAPLAIKEIGVFPPGALVKLKNGEIGVVIHRGKDSTHPIVKSIIGPFGAPLEHLMSRNTEDKAFGIIDFVPRDRSVKLNLRRIWDYPGDSSSR